MLYKKHKISNVLSSSPNTKKSNITLRSTNHSDSSFYKDSDEEQDKKSIKLNKSFDIKASSAQQQQTPQKNNNKGNTQNTTQPSENLLQDRLDKLININSQNKSSPVKTNIAQVPIIEVISPPITERKKIVTLKRPPFIRKNKFSNQELDQIIKKWQAPLPERIIQYSPKRPVDCLKSKVEEQLIQVIQKKQQFTDEEFPPNFSSLSSITKLKNNVQQKSLNLSASNNSQMKMKTEEDDNDSSFDNKAQKKQGLNTSRSFVYQKTRHQKLADQMNIYRSCNTWLRAKQIYSKNNIYLTKFIDPVDLEEGMLTSSFKLLASLSALAENPSRILKLLEDQTYNESGCYYVRICKDGIWRYILLDDFFPVHIQGTIIAQTHAYNPQIMQESNNTLNEQRPSNDSQKLSQSIKQFQISSKNQQQAGKQDVELWQSLIEKAIIKTYGCYQDFKQANPSIKEILRELTGAPIKDINLIQDSNMAENSVQWLNQIKYQIVNALYKNQIVILSKEKDVDPQQQQKQQNFLLLDVLEENKADQQQSQKFDYSQIPEEYAFTVLSCNFQDLGDQNEEVQQNKKNKLDQIVIRNYQGWNQEIDPESFTENLDKQNQSLGSYLFDIQFLLKHFNHLIIAHVEDENFYVARQMRHLRSAYSISSFTLQNPGTVTLEVSQIDKRLFRNHLKEEEVYNFSFVRIILTRLVPFVNINEQQQEEYKEDSSQKSKSLSNKSLIQKKKYSQSVLPMQQQWEFVDGVAACDKVVSLQCLHELEAGEYRVIISIDWKDMQVYDFVLNYYGPQQIILKRVEYKYMPNFVANALQEITVLHGSKNNSKTVCEHIYVSEQTYTLSICAENKTNQNQIYVRDLSKLNRQCLELMTIQDDKQAQIVYKMLTQQIINQYNYGTITMELKPQEKKTIVFKIINYSLAFDNNIYKKLGLK